MGTGGVSKRLRRALALAACGVLGLSGVAAGIDLFPPTPEVTFTASFGPKELPKHRAAPVAARFTAKVRMSDGSFPIPVRELDLGLDRHLKVEADDLPPNAIVATGKMKWLVAFPEQPPLPITGEVTIRHKASKGPRTRLVGVARVNRPKPAKLFFPITMTRAPDGRYGWKMVFSVPRAGGGAGSLTYLGLKFRKGFLSAACADGRLQAQARTRFVDGTLISGAVLRACETEKAKRAAGNPAGFFNADFLPKKLSKTKPTPTNFDFTVIRRVHEGADLPALKQLVLQADKRIEIDVRGIPTCNLGGRDVRRGIGEVRKLCKPALVGEGSTEALVQFPEQAPIPVKSEVLVINGAVEGGVTKLYLYSFFSAPVTGATVTTMEIKRVHNGRFGTKAVATFPKIAGGSGSITSLRVSLEKDIVSATCGADRYLKVHGKALFADGTNLAQPVVRTCVPVP